jgi:glyoxalase/bleomycin resistance protein/dioxygenase superfamily protein
VTLTAKTVMPFVPCNDFTICGRFYIELGFEKSFDDGKLAVFRCGTAGFYLQDYRWPSASDNYMLLLDVDDVDTWWRRIETADLARKYGVKAAPPRLEPWGARVLRLTDPTGVLWHVAQRTS